MNIYTLLLFQSFESISIYELKLILQQSHYSPKIYNLASSSITNVHAFSEEISKNSTCHVDLSVKPDIPGNHTICLGVNNERLETDTSIFHFFGTFFSSE